MTGSKFFAPYPKLTPEELETLIEKDEEAFERQEALKRKKQTGSPDAKIDKGGTDHNGVLIDLKGATKPVPSR